MVAHSAPQSLSSLLALVPDQVASIFAWEKDFKVVKGAGKKGRTERMQALAERRGEQFGQVKKLYYAWAKSGAAGLINRKATPALWNGEEQGLSAADEDLVKLWCESFQRKSEPAIRALREAWLSQMISAEHAHRGLAVPHTETKLNPLTGYPIGWSERNLMRYAPSQYELKAARIGRSAADSHRPLVYTTRVGMYVGQFYLFDDMWHDHVVNDLDQRKSGRPLEFHALDLGSARKIAWGNRIRIETEKGHEGLKAADFRFLIAALLGTQGYHPAGTTLVVEHGTAAISDRIMDLLGKATGGAIKVARGGMEGAAAHGGQYAGRSKGNFRFKASLESLGNLIHNEMAYLPGQVGKDRQHCPEEMHDGGRLVDAATGKALAAFGALKHNDALLAALSQLPAERAQWLQWPFCTIQQFRLICEEVYARINRRTDHDLEGWDERYIPDARSGRMRRLSPEEVYRSGNRPLCPIDLETVALIIGTESGTERLTRNGMFELRDGEISGDALRFDATMLPDREKFLTVLNPFDCSKLFVFDARSRFVTVAERIASVCRADTEAVHRRMGAAAKTEAKLLQPLRARHMAQERERAKMHANNAEVLAGATMEELRREDRLEAEERRETAREEEAVRNVDLVAETLARPVKAAKDAADEWA